MRVALPTQVMSERDRRAIAVHHDLDEDLASRDVFIDIVQALIDKEIGDAHASLREREAEEEIERARAEFEAARKRLEALELGTPPF